MNRSTYLPRMPDAPGKSSSCSKPRRARRLEGLSLDNPLCFALYALSLAATTVYRPLLSGPGLTYPQYTDLAYAYAHAHAHAHACGPAVEPACARRQ